MNDYQKHWIEFNSELREIETRSGDLRAVFAALNAHQVETGFIRGSLEDVERFEFCHPEKGSPCLRIQFNPERATRFEGAGVRSPSSGAPQVHDGCYLCPANIRSQQQGRQFGYELGLNGNPFIAWMNPFPLLPGHLVLASKEHVGQEWSLNPEGQLTPDQIVSDLVELVSRAPGYAGFYNGVNAGASIPGHLHYQLFQPPEDHRRFPLEIEAMAVRSAQPGRSDWRLGQYPVETMHWHGEPGDIIGQATGWIEEWAAHQERLPDLTANILAVSEENGAEVSLYFVPRDRDKSQAEGLAGKVGGLEVLGELVFSTPEEQELLESGLLNYFSLERVLSEVRTPLNMP
jgi:diadenosine tetraphosphate (Ap4A) HIT family hydrolase